MSRRTSLPGASELFRSTRDGAEQPAPVVSAPPAGAAELLAAAVPRTEPAREPAVAEAALAVHRPAGRRKVDRDAERRPTGRERHDEKITVYVSAEELMDLERARLTLRGDHGLAVDRGRIVREALAVALADLEAHGDRSTLVRRLHGA